MPAVCSSHANGITRSSANVGLLFTALGSPLLCLSTRLGAASFWWPVFLIPDFSWWAVLVWGGGGEGMQVLCIQGEEYKLGYHFSATIHLHFSSSEGFSLTWNLQCRQHCLGRKSERSTYLCLPALGLQARTITPSFLYVGSVDQSRSLCLQAKHVTS